MPSETLPQTREQWRAHDKKVAQSVLFMLDVCEALRAREPLSEPLQQYLDAIDRYFSGEADWARQANPAFKSIPASALVAALTDVECASLKKAHPALFKDHR